MSTRLDRAKEFMSGRNIVDAADMAAFADGEIIRAEILDKSSPKHCPTCICGRRAPVQGEHYCENDGIGHGPGTISWLEHLLVWSGYAARYGQNQSAERMAERGGFCYGELEMFLGHKPETWEPIR